MLRRERPDQTSDALFRFGGSRVIFKLFASSSFFISEILPHVDSVKFVGRGLATISLLSDSILRFRRVDDPDEFVDILGNLTHSNLY